jgi:hypothetical protein
MTRELREFLIDYWRENLASKRTHITQPVPPTLENVAQARFDLCVFQRLQELETE